MPVRITPAVKALLIANFVMFIVQQTADQFLGGNLTGLLGLVPAGFVLDFRVWQIFTYAFLHGDVLHLFLNLMMLAFIGGELEALWGTARFLRYYFFCTVSAGAFYLLLQAFSQGGGFHVPMVGASGGIYGLLVAYGLVFGERVLLFMMLFPMKAKHFIWVLAAVEFLSTVFSRGGLSSVAHLGGMAAGFGFLWGRAAWSVYRKRRLESKEVSRRERKRKAAEHLKLVINNEKDDRDDQDTPRTWH